MNTDLMYMPTVPTELYLIIIYSITLFVSVVCLLIVMSLKPSREQKLTMCFSLFITLAILGSWYSAASECIVESEVATGLIYTALPNIYYSMFLLISRYCKVDPPKWVKTLMVSVNLLVACLSLTNKYHHLFFVSENLRVENGYVVFDKGAGPLFPFAIAVIVTYNIVMTIIVIGYIQRLGKRKSKKRTRVEKYSSVGLLAALFISTSAFLISRVIIRTVDLVPFAVLLSEGVFLFLLYELRVYDVMDYAQEFAYDSTEEGIVALDMRMNFCGANKVAVNMFNEFANASIGEPFRKLSPELAGAFEADVLKDIHSGEQVVRMLVKSIVANNKLRGYVIRFRDVTSEIETLDVFEKFRKQLEYEVADKTSRYRNLQEHLIMSFACLEEGESTVNKGHVKRVNAYLSVLLKTLIDRGDYSNALSSSLAYEIRSAAPLHDIGKRVHQTRRQSGNEAVTDEKPSLSEIAAATKRHPIESAKIIERDLTRIEDDVFTAVAKEMALYHHERWDGSGYPNAVKGEQIPLCARILSVVNDFDNLLSEIPNATREDLDAMFVRIGEGSGKAYDPIIVDAFIASKQDIIEVRRVMAAEQAALYH